MGLFDLFKTAEDPEQTALVQRLRRNDQEKVRKLTREIADLDRRHAHRPDPQAYRAIRRDLEVNLSIAQDNLRYLG